MTTWSRRLVVLVLAASACTGEPTAVPTARPSLSPSSSPTCTPPTIPTPFPEWRGAPNARIARLEVAAVAIGDRTYLAGGLVQGGATAAVEAYPDGAPVPDLPVEIHHASAVDLEGDVVVLGGFVGPSSQTASNRVFRLTSDRWEEMPNLIRARGAGGAAVVDGMIVVTGGQADGELLKTTEAFDGTSWREVAPIPTPRDHLAVAAHDRFVYAIGGRRLSQDSVLATVERYDVVADTWSRVTDLPTPRGGMGAVTVGSAIVVAGGEGSREDAGPDGVFSQVERLDTRSLRWTAMPRMKTPRHGIGFVGTTGRDRCTVVGATITALVGGTRAGLSVSRTVETFFFWSRP